MYKNVTDTTTVTISKSISDIGFALSFIKADTDSKTSGLAPVRDREFAVFNISKTFQLILKFKVISVYKKFINADFINFSYNFVENIIQLLKFYLINRVLTFLNCNVICYQ